MEVAIGVAAVTSPVLNRVERLYVFQGDLIDVVKSAPAEKYLVGLNVDLIEERVSDPAILGASHRTEISPGDIVACDQHCSIRRHCVLVHVNPRHKRGAVNTAQRLVVVVCHGNIVDALIGLIQNLNNTVSPTKGLWYSKAVEVCQDRLPIQLLYSETLQVTARALPDKLILVRHNKHAVLMRVP